MRFNFLTKITLVAIIALGSFLRFYGLNWDQGHNLHPDERAIILTVLRINPPDNISDFLSPDSSWNPQFFAYGSFPMYLLYFISHAVGFLDPRFMQYDFLAIVGRHISVFADLVTILVLFLIGCKLFNERVGLIASLSYAISVLPIQLSHFYAVDTLLTMFIVLTLYQLILLYEKPSIKKSILIGLFFGLALATKISSTVLIVSIGTAIAADFILVFLKQPHRPKDWIPHVPKFLKNLFLYGICIAAITIAIFVFIEPYAVIDFDNFWLQTMQQQAMTKDAFTFPYTLQYVGKIPYLYELKNIFFFGLGPILSVLSFIGIFYFILTIFKKNKKEKWAQETILLIFFVAYFIVVGKFAIGFMRYMLPLYPLLCLFAAIAIYKIFNKIKNKKIFVICALLFALCVFTWPLSFTKIYSQNNTRVDATDWILKNIPQGEMILVEHWDDRLPITSSENYVIEDLELYNPDTPEKWLKINQQLNRADYIIIASNRLYAPLQRLTDCKKLPSYRCYTRTTVYYQQLFSEELGFKKIAEFNNYPTVPFLNIKIDDQKADESFTVYDHPKVMVFKKQ